MRLLPADKDNATELYEHTGRRYFLVSPYAVLPLGLLAMLRQQQCCTFINLFGNQRCTNRVSSYDDSCRTPAYHITLVQQGHFSALHAQFYI